MAIVWRIAFPLALPAAAAFAIFSVAAHWNDLFWPLMAAAIVTAPLVVAFLLAQRKFIQGLAAGGIKG